MRCSRLAVWCRVELTVEVGAQFGEPVSARIHREPTDASCHEMDALARVCGEEFQQHLTLLSKSTEEVHRSAESTELAQERSQPSCARGNRDPECTFHRDRKAKFRSERARPIVTIREHHRLSVLARFEELLCAAVNVPNFDIDVSIMINRDREATGCWRVGGVRADEDTHPLIVPRILLLVSEHPRLRVGVIGSGRAGSVLGAALARAGHDVVGFYGVSDLSRLRAEAMLTSAVFMEATDLAASVDLVLLTVPDDVLPDVARGLATADAVRPGSFVVHASGRYGVEVLRPMMDAGALPMALHPVMTFTGTSVDLARLGACPFGVTTLDVLRPAAETLVVEMGGEPIWIPEESRALYHAAIANGANHLITLVAQTLELLGAAGIEQPQQLMGPLLSASLDNVLRLGDAALTGPVARGDADTVRAHIAELSARSDEATRAYLAMARLTADRALAAGMLKPADAQRLLDVLQGPR